MSVYSIGRYYDDFKVGEKIEHALSKTIFESDNNFFSLLTMNFHPVHTNSHYAAAEVHQEILVVGTLVFSLAVGLTVPDISGHAVANLEYSEVLHLNPVFVGDTIYASSQILGLRVSNSDPKRGIVHVKTLVTNQRGEDVLSFERKALVKRRQ